MSYFKTSYATLQKIAQQGRYEDLAGFLVMARHASGLRHAGFEPYQLSGAGVNGIHEKAGVSEEAARGVVERLQQQGLIRTTSTETQRAFRHGRWEMRQGELDLELPHTFVDGIRDGGVSSALTRIRKHTIVPKEYAKELEKVSDTDLKLDALMLLLAAYRNTSMCDFGGISPACIWRGWEVQSRTPKLNGVRWGAEPEKHISRTSIAFMREALGHAAQNKKELGNVAIARFWNAWNTIRVTGLAYEAVCLFDTSPRDNPRARLELTLRVNDFHAGSGSRDGDPGLLRILEIQLGTRFAFYTPAENERGETEAMWVVLPSDRGALVGVWRLRFRAKTQDVGAWFEQEEERTRAVWLRLEQAAADDSSTPF